MSLSLPVCLYGSLSVYVTTYPSVYISACKSVWLSTCIAVCIHVYFTDSKFLIIIKLSCCLYPYLPVCKIACMRVRNCLYVIGVHLTVQWLSLYLSSASLYRLLLHYLSIRLCIWPYVSSLSTRLFVCIARILFMGLLICLSDYVCDCVHLPLVRSVGNCLFMGYWAYFLLFS